MSPATELVQAASCVAAPVSRPPSRRLRALRSRSAGVTLLELMLAVALACVLGTIAVVTYGSAMERTRLSRAVADITELQLLLSRFNTNQGRFPANLAELGAAGRVDPWGNAYRYLNFEGLSGTGAMRKDRNLVPINSDFDLYSAGPDGDTRPPLTARPSRDDIVRANDGRFVGKASDY